jgi:hypothetical protein
MELAPNTAWKLQIRYHGSLHRSGLANERSPPHAPAMFVVTEEDAATIRAVYQQPGEFAAARFPGITNNAQARGCARHRGLETAAAAAVAGEADAQPRRRGPVSVIRLCGRAVMAKPAWAMPMRPSSSAMTS